MDSERRRITITVEVQVWKELNRLKDVGESLSDVIQKLIQFHQSHEGENE